MLLDKKRKRKEKKDRKKGKRKMFARFPINKEHVYSFPVSRKKMCNPFLSFQVVEFEKKKKMLTSFQLTV